MKPLIVRLRNWNSRCKKNISYRKADVTKKTQMLLSRLHRQIIIMLIVKFLANFSQLRHSVILKIQNRTHHFILPIRENHSRMKNMTYKTIFQQIKRTGKEFYHVVRMWNRMA